MSVPKKITQGKRIRLKESLVQVEEGTPAGLYNQYFTVLENGKVDRTIFETLAVIPQTQAENKVKILHPVTTSPVWVDGDIFELVDPVRPTVAVEE